MVNKNQKIPIINYLLYLFIKEVVLQKDITMFALKFKSNDINLMMN